MNLWLISTPSKTKHATIIATQIMNVDSRKLAEVFSGSTLTSFSASNFCLVLFIFRFFTKLRNLISPQWIKDWNRICINPFLSHSIFTNNVLIIPCLFSMRMRTYGPNLYEYVKHKHKCVIWISNIVRIRIFPNSIMT